MTSSIKNDTSWEVVGAIQSIEERADECFESLAIRNLHWNVALWALLSGGIKMVEEEIESGGDNTSDLSATLLNVSRMVPLAMKWAKKHGKPPSTLATRRWTPGLSEKVDEALDVARRYSQFEACLPMWHKNRCSAELLSPTLVRFIAPGSARGRQVSAYQKGFRPLKGSFIVERARKVDQTPMIRKLVEEVLRTPRKTGQRRFDYHDCWSLWEELLGKYETRVATAARRPDELSLGDYTLSDFNRFYAAFLAVCAAHDFLCFTWGRNHRLYPLDSAVMVRSCKAWAYILSKLSGINANTCESMIDDLTFDFERSLDLHVHPFVPLDAARQSFAVAPHFPLHSRHDENILRVCSARRQGVFDTASLEKEGEMLAELRKRCPLHALRGPVTMPTPTSDIDLIISDEKCSTILIAELKWIRKPLRPVERIDRDRDVLKGIEQLSKIRQFLNNNPDHLRASGKLPRRFNDYEHTHYLLVSRDHWFWLEPADGVAIVEFEPFSTALSRTENLHSAVNDVLSYEWLPVEGRDFTVRYDRTTVNGVSIESEVFYAS